MITPLFIDTGAFVARVLKDDQFHLKAKEGWLQLEHDERPLYSSEHVLDESATLIARRAGYGIAAEWLDRHLRSNLITWLQSSNVELLDATKLMKKFADQRVSYTDCLSFVFMKRERCKQVFSFDDHFARAGFVLWKW